DHRTAQGPRGRRDLHLAPPGRGLRDRRSRDGPQGRGRPGDVRSGGPDARVPRGEDGRARGQPAPATVRSGRRGRPRRARGIGARDVTATEGPRLRDIRLTLRAGEVVGLAGLVGAGRTELALALFGARSGTTGDVRIDGRRVAFRSPADAIKA